jgi:hypothetical protein
LFGYCRRRQLRLGCPGPGLSAAKESHGSVEISHIYPKSFLLQVRLQIGRTQALISLTPAFSYLRRAPSHVKPYAEINTRVFLPDSHPSALTLRQLPTVCTSIPSLADGLRWRNHRLRGDHCWQKEGELLEVQSTLNIITYSVTIMRSIRQTQ